MKETGNTWWIALVIFLPILFICVALIKCCLRKKDNKCHDEKIGNMYMDGECDEEMNEMCKEKQ